MYIKNAEVVILTDFTDLHFWSRTAGPYRIATEIRNHGYTCQVIDCFAEFTTDQIFDAIIEYIKFLKKRIHFLIMYA